MAHAILNNYCQKNGTKPDFRWSSTKGHGMNASWTVQIVIPGIPHQPVAHSATKKEAQREVTQAMVEFLTNSGILADQPKKLKNAEPMAAAAEKPDTPIMELGISGLSSGLIPVDSQVQRMLDLVRRSDPDGALAIAVAELGVMPGCLSVKFMGTLLAALSCRTDPEAAIRFIDGIETMELVKFPDPAVRSYFMRFARWGIRELLAEAESCIHRCEHLDAAELEAAGQTIAMLTAAAHKGQLELSLNGTIPKGSKFIKGDWLFITFPHTGHVGYAPVAAPVSVADGVTTMLPMGSFEAEVTGFEANNAGMRVKFVGIQGQMIQKLVGLPCRVDRAVNRIDFVRQMEALRSLCTGETLTDGAWLRQVLVASDIRDENGQGVQGLEKQLCGEHAFGVNISKQLSTSPLWQLANVSQKAALHACLRRRLTLIQGPPGSGKTHTAVLLVRLWIAAGRTPVLAAAESNIAVDNILTGLALLGIPVVRVGRPETSRPDLEKYTLERMAAHGGDGERQWVEDISTLWPQQKKILSRTPVVCATCSGAFNAVLDGMQFQTVLIDEAAQATEHSITQPLLHLSSTGTGVLIGDHKQLPPMVVCQAVQTEGLGTPLFDRLMSRGVEPLMLDVQYRMHPAIADFPSKQYYGGKLRTGVPAHERPAPKGIKWPSRYAPVCFAEAPGYEEAEGSSWYNRGEATYVAKMVNDILEEGDVMTQEIAVITPYAAQVRLLKRQLSFLVSKHKWDGFGLEVNSVDGFQGREKDVIVVSTVRANQTGNVGFLNDPRRLNVTLTRARRGLVVCGNSATLSADKHCWGPWLLWAKRCGLLFGVKDGGNTAQREAEKKMEVAQKGHEQKYRDQMDKLQSEAEMRAKVEQDKLEMRKKALEDARQKAEEDERRRLAMELKAEMEAERKRKEEYVRIQREEEERIKKEKEEAEKQLKEDEQQMFKDVEQERDQIKEEQKRLKELARRSPSASMQREVEKEKKRAKRAQADEREKERRQKGGGKGRSRSREGRDGGKRSFAGLKVSKMAMARRGKEDREGRDDRGRGRDATRRDDRDRRDERDRPREAVRRESRDEGRSGRDRDDGDRDKRPVVAETDPYLGLEDAPAAEGRVRTKRVVRDAEGEEGRTRRKDLGEGDAEKKLLKRRKVMKEGRDDKGEKVSRKSRPEKVMLEPARKETVMPDGDRSRDRDAESSMRGRSRKEPDDRAYGYGASEGGFGYGASKKEKEAKGEPRPSSKLERSSRKHGDRGAEKKHRRGSERQAMVLE